MVPEKEAPTLQSEGREIRSEQPAKTDAEPSPGPWIGALLGGAGSPLTPPSSATGPSAPPTPARPDPMLSRSLLHLQRTAGNAAVQRMLTKPASGPVTVQRVGETDRERIDTALKSRDPADVKKIKSFGAANNAEAIQLIQILLNQGWVGPYDEEAIENIWGSFGPSLPHVASVHLGLWDQCRDRGAELEDLDQVKKLRDDFKKDTLAKANSHLSNNEKYVRDEMTRYGVSAVNVGGMPVLDMPISDAEVKKLEETKQLAKHVETLKAWQEELRRARVGKGAEPFDPNRPPVEDFNIGDVPSFEFVKQGWDQTEDLLGRILNSNPAIFAAMNQGNLKSLSEGDPKKNPDAMRQKVKESLMTVLLNIEVARKNLNDGTDYRDLKPVHTALMSGQGGSQPWSQPFYSWVIRNDVKGHEKAEAYKSLALQAAIFVALVAADIATVGGATFIIAASAGIAGSALQADRAQEKYNQLLAAQQAQASTGTGLVTKGQVDAAEAQAQMAKVELAINVVGLSIGAAMRARAAAKAGAPGTPGEAGGPGAAPGTTPVPGAAVAPGPVVPGTPGAVPVTQQAWTETGLIVMLEQTSIGKGGLRLWRKFQVKVVKAKGKTYFFNAPEVEMVNGAPKVKKPAEIHLGEDFTLEEAHNAFNHEILHGAREFGKRSGKVLQMSQNQYVETMLREEATAQANAIRGKFQWQAATGRRMQATTPLEEVYAEAYQETAMRLRNANKALPEAERLAEAAIDQQAVAEATEEVYKGFKFGRVVPSVEQGKTYVDYYKDIWENANYWKLPGAE